MRKRTRRVMAKARYVLCKCGLPVGLHLATIVVHGTDVRYVCPNCGDLVQDEEENG